MPIPHAHRSYDTRKARAFYTALFGWEYTEVPAVAGDYAFVSSGGTTFGAVTAANTDPPSWLAHVGVEDVRAATVKARALGARVEVECQPFGRLGTLSVIVDPTGARVGLMARRDPQGVGERCLVSSRLRPQVPSGTPARVRVHSRRAPGCPRERILTVRVSVCAPSRANTTIVPDC